jgi:hypothetical protein
MQVAVSASSPAATRCAKAMRCRAPAPLSKPPTAGPPMDPRAGRQQIGAGLSFAMMVRQRTKPGAVLALPNHKRVAGVCCGPTPVISVMPPDCAVLRFSAPCRVARPVARRCFYVAVPRSALTCLSQNRSHGLHAPHAPALNPHLTKTRLNVASRLCEMLRRTVEPARHFTRDSGEMRHRCIATPACG